MGVKVFADIGPMFHAAQLFGTGLTEAEHNTRNQ